MSIKDYVIEGNCEECFERGTYKWDSQCQFDFAGTKGWLHYFVCEICQSKEVVFSTEFVEIDQEDEDWYTENQSLDDADDE